MADGERNFNCFAQNIPSLGFSCLYARNMNTCFTISAKVETIYVNLNDTYSTLDTAASLDIYSNSKRRNVSLTCAYIWTPGVHPTIKLKSGFIAPFYFKFYEIILSERSSGNDLGDFNRFPPSKIPQIAALCARENPVLREKPLAWTPRLLTGPLCTSAELVSSVLNRFL